MGYISEKPHFVLFPFVAQGHLLPMVDIGTLMAQRDVIVTIVTTPHNADRVQKSISKAIELVHPIRLVQLRFPGNEVGLPDGVENVDMVHSVEDFRKFFVAANKMEDEVEKLFKVPRISFNGFCCFCTLCLHNIHSSKIHETVGSDSEYFTVPGLTEKVEFTKVQLPLDRVDESWKEIVRSFVEASKATYGVVINTFEELEPAFVEEYRKVTKAWCIGPVSLSHKDESDKAERGNKASINEQQCLKWLDSKGTKSVIYACLGSISTVKCPELIELGLGL
ncbi:UDP-Glycosyltransferase superfamily protein [Hibiscus syriacus]|uniref:UDP-Glycosyltransferase superfamily protein n=1 Tax=Hibiscus syriacus TaxID=106335 RepID=A0A6A3BQX6_HIBSY|nr:UDP-Glycosyltransferase superfamily protein [Hibiscus syriacus]